MSGFSWALRLEHVSYHLPYCFHCMLQTNVRGSIRKGKLLLGTSPSRSATNYCTLINKILRISIPEFSFWGTLPPACHKLWWRMWDTSSWPVWQPAPQSLKFLIHMTFVQKPSPKHTVSLKPIGSSLLTGQEASKCPPYRINIISCSLSWSDQNIYSIILSFHA